MNKYSFETQWHSRYWAIIIIIGVAFSPAHAFAKWGAQTSPQQSSITLPSQTSGQEQTRSKSMAEITLAGAIKRTLANAPYLHEYTFKQAALEGQMQTAKLKPEFVAGIEVENFLGSGAVSGVREAEITLTLSSVIEFGNQRDARVSLVSVKSSVLDAQKRIRTLDVLADVTRRYIAVLAQQEVLAAQKEAEALARYTYQAVAKRAEAGASPAFEQLRAGSSLAKARLELLSAEQTLTSLIKSLAIMWGEQHPSFTQVQGNLFDLPPSPSLTSLFTTLLSSPNMDVFAQESRLQEAQVRLTQSASQTDIAWMAGVRRMSGIDEVAFVAGVNMPLFASARNLGEYEEQKAMLELIEQQKQTAILGFYHQLNMTLSARNNALLNVQTLKDAIIPPLQEALLLVEQAYLEGRFSYLEWISISQELLAAKQALIQSAKEAHQRGADIESLTAQALSTDPVSAVPLSTSTTLSSKSQ